MPPPSQIHGKQVVVTGGKGALGRSVVESLTKLGADVRAVGREVDLRDESVVERFYAGLDNLWASIHLVGGFAAAAVEKTTAADVRNMIESNAMTCFLCCREAVRRIRANRHKGGRIVNVAARPVVHPAGGMTAYVMSKAAVATLTQCLAEELKQENILVNAVLPSLMDTPANRAAMPDADFDSWPKTHQVAETVIFLASPSNALTSGTLVPVYGRA